MRSSTEKLITTWNESLNTMDGIMPIQIISASEFQGRNEFQEMKWLRVLLEENEE